MSPKSQSSLMTIHRCKNVSGVDALWTAPITNAIRGILSGGVVIAKPASCPSSYEYLDFIGFHVSDKVDPHVCFQVWTAKRNLMSSAGSFESLNFNVRRCLNTFRPREDQYRAQIEPTVLSILAIFAAMRCSLRSLCRTGIWSRSARSDTRGGG